MRWDDLFDDLAGHAEHAEHLDRAAELADRIRRDQATVVLGDRLRAATQPVTVVLRDASTITGAVQAVGPGWVLLRETGSGRQVLLPEGAVAGVRGVPARSAAPAGAVEARRTFLMAVRALAHGSVRVGVRTPAFEVQGLLDRVGADHLDVVVGAGVVRTGAQRGQARETVQTIPFSAVLAVLERS